MGLSRSTFYATLQEKPSDGELVAEIRAITDVFECYGYRHIGAELCHRGLVVNAKKIRRLTAATGRCDSKDSPGTMTFASHQNDVPVLLELWVENPSEAPMEDLRLSVSADPAIFGARERTIDRLDVSVKLRIADRRLPLADGMLDKLTDRLRVDVRVALCKGDEVLLEVTDKVER